MFGGFHLHLHFPIFFQFFHVDHYLFRQQQLAVSVTVMSRGRVELEVVETFWNFIESQKNKLEFE